MSRYNELSGGVDCITNFDLDDSDQDDLRDVLEGDLQTEDLNQCCNGFSTFLRCSGLKKESKSGFFGV